jgi:phage shock protein PspC (stress-responsive transcriptional regulator)
MNKVITINLNGVAYQLEEGGYDALRAYLDHAARRLEGNPDKEEIITDIEQSIADKFRALLGVFKTVVNAREVSGVIAEMGPVEGDSTETAGQAATGAGRASDAASGPKTGETSGASTFVPRRLYKITDGAMLAGVCNGVAAYLNLDVTIVRLLFTLLTFFWGAGVLVYLVMAIIVPEARTSAEKAAASGMASTAQAFIKRAREGYYDGMKSFHDKQSRRAWKRKFKQEMRGWKYGFRQQMQEQSQPWQQHWAQQAPPVFGPVFIAPLLSILLFLLVVLMLWAIYSLVTVHAVFGLALPATMPLWVGILLVVIAYQLAAWPIKAVRYSCYYPRPHCGSGGPWGGLIGSLIGMFFLAFGVWSLDRHVPEFHEWLVQLPVLLHRFADVVQGWFAKQA